eukprot:Gregarina_sp_Poly_1__5183@NODE_274_length_10212_cov_70_754460_g239_i0_p4_GENE_NODE_274_length_10212_cov_70_754460_g239_i0NODE_274_length_10212_cov_70_754460_g239_i0_p4_ORF_typecomplete_len330_score19_31DHHC/PF01529_20/1_5e02DHHC/PF01529_20/1_2e26DUF35_N/PF12172_8/0_0039_NODE_274_length_10212_cov_70_754460_g239_i052990
MNASGCWQQLLHRWSGSLLVIWTWLAMAVTNFLTLVYYFGHPHSDLGEFSHQWYWFHRLYRKSVSHGLTLFWLILFEAIHGLAIISHMMAVCADPGSLDSHCCPVRVPEDMLERTKEFKPEDLELVLGSKCEKCGGRWKPPRAHHCNRCDNNTRRCIFRMDHHCTWIGNCIGQSNQKYFILFLAYSVMGALLNVLFFPALWISCWGSGNCQQRSLWIGTCLVTLCLALGHMANTYLSEMIEAIQTNSTLVESYQGTHGKQQKMQENLEEIFGPYKYTWWLPIPPCIRLDFKEIVWRDAPAAKQPENASQNLK